MMTVSTHESTLAPPHARSFEHGEYYEGRMMTNWQSRQLCHPVDTRRCMYRSMTSAC